MTYRTLFMIATIAMLATLGALGSASACCKAKFERTKPHVNVGTIGHVKRKQTSSQTTVIGGIGRNWKQTAPSTQQQELLIFVTPYVVRPAN